MIKNRFVYILSGLLLSACLFIGCKDDEAADPSLTVINKFYPTKGGVGTEILITGKNLTDDMSQVSVTVGGKPLTIIGCNSTGIMAVVPKKLGSGLMKVKIGEREYTCVEEFTYLFSATVTTLAGSGVAGFADGQGHDAQFSLMDPDRTWRKGAICVDNDLNVYLADAGNNCIRKIKPDGTVSLLAGRPGSYNYVDGTGSAAEFQEMYGMDCDAQGNIYVSDLGNPQTIRKVTPEGVVTTLYTALSPAPWYLAVDKRDGTIYTANPESGGILQIKPDGTKTHIVQNVSIAGITVDLAGNLFATEFGTNLIVKFDAGTWQRTVIAGSSSGYEDGSVTSARFANPWGIKMDSNGDLYVAGNGVWDGGSNPDQSIRMIDRAAGLVRTVAGSTIAGYVDANGASAAFNAPLDLALDKNGVIYVFDRRNNVVRKIIYE